MRHLDLGESPLHLPCPHALLKICHKFFPFAFFLSLACCSGGTLTSEMVHLLSPTEYKLFFFVCFFQLYLLLITGRLRHLQLQIGFFYLSTL
jgi:hypothetical protein